jgi:hypothetical protein
MARKQVPEAMGEYLQIDYDRWRLLARRKDFRTDLCAYLNAFEKLDIWSKRHEGRSYSRKTLNKYYQLKGIHLGKWGVELLPELKLWPDQEKFITPGRLERWYGAARQNKSSFSAFGSPVRILGSQAGGRFQYIIEISVDRTLTLDVLMPLIWDQLRHSYFGAHSREKPSVLDSQLQIFDYMQTPIKGKLPTLKQAANKLDKSASTIRDAYVSICRKINLMDRHYEFVDSIARPILKNPKLRHLLDPEDLSAPANDVSAGDISTCPDCGEVSAIEDLCPTHQALIPKDKLAWRERPVPDLSAIEHARARRDLSRKNVWSDPFSDD